MYSRRQEGDPKAETGNHKRIIHPVSRKEVISRLSFIYTIYLSTFGTNFFLSFFFWGGETPRAKNLAHEKKKYRRVLCFTSFLLSDNHGVRLIVLGVSLQPLKWCRNATNYLTLDAR